MKMQKKTQKPTMTTPCLFRRPRKRMLGSTKVITFSGERKISFPSEEEYPAYKHQHLRLQHRLRNLSFPRQSHPHKPISPASAAMQLLVPHTSHPIQAITRRLAYSETLVRPRTLWASKHRHPRPSRALSHLKKGQPAQARLSACLLSQQMLLPLPLPQWPLLWLTRLGRLQVSMGS